MHPGSFLLPEHMKFYTHTDRQTKNKEPFLTFAGDFINMSEIKVPSKSNALNTSLIDIKRDNRCCQIPLTEPQTYMQFATSLAHFI